MHGCGCPFTGSTDLLKCLSPTVRHLVPCFDVQVQQDGDIDATLVARVHGSEGLRATDISHNLTQSYASVDLFEDCCLCIFFCLDSLIALVLNSAVGISFARQNTSIRKEDVELHPDQRLSANEENERKDKKEK